jgi:C4-dicarboxylate transporter DctQ subunit
MTDGGAATTFTSITRFIFVRVPYLIGGTLIFIAIAINFANVIGRYVFFTAIYWAEEVLVFMIIWGVFLSAASIAYQGANIRMDLFSSLIRSPFKEIVGGLTALMLAGAAIFVMFQSYRVISLHAMNDTTSITSDIPLTIPNSALFVGFGLVALATLIRVRAYIVDQFD